MFLVIDACRRSLRGNRWVEQAATLDHEFLRVFNNLYQALGQIVLIWRKKYGSL
jgi:hypothetical protein